MLLKRLALLACSLGLAVLMLAACGGTSAPTSTGLTTSTTPAASATYAAYADAGRVVYAGHCAKCHGDQGQGITGPVLVGPSASLTKYTTAQGLLSFISSAMPLDAPGSLTHQEYLQVLSLILVWNNYTAGSSAFNEGALGSVQLK